MRVSSRVIGAVGIALGIGLAAPRAGLAQEERTVEGEIVDPAAYVKSGSRGPDMVDLTYEAVDGGQTLGLLDAGGALYLLLAEEAGEDPNELVYDYVNQKVKISGKVYERGGMKGIVAASVEPLEPPADETAAAAGTPAP
jgi:hypothetical protein